MDLDIHEKKDGITLPCYVKPRAKKNMIKGVREGALVVTISAPPQKEQANRQLMEFMALALNIPSSRITLLKGKHSREKLLFIHGFSKREAISRLVSPLV